MMAAIRLILGALLLITALIFAAPYVIGMILVVGGMTLFFYILQRIGDRQAKREDRK